MNDVLGLGLAAAKVETSSEPDLQLLVELEPWPRVFFHNLLDLLLWRGPGKIELSSPPGFFWPDVFVHRPLPWRSFVESAGYHMLAIVLAAGLSELLQGRIQPTRRPFDAASVASYPVSEYLPPLDTGSRPAPPQKGDPEYAKQPIISVPPEADNRTQTMVTPPDLKLDRDVSLPNIVAWTETPLPVPTAAATRSAADLKIPALPVAAVAPPPQVAQETNRKVPSLSAAVIAPAPEISTSRVLYVQPLQPAIIEPPPSITVTTRRLGDVNIGHAQVVAPAPQLPMPEQRTAAVRMGPALSGADAQVVPPPPSVQGVKHAGVGRTGAGGDLGTGAQVIPPPPAIQGPAGANSGGRLIALGIHPADVKAPIRAPQGNRRGTFAATPEGRGGAAGTPSSAAGTDHGGGQGGTDGHPASGGGGNHALAGVPPGIHVGAASRATSDIGGDPYGENAKQESSDPTVIATLTPPGVPVVAGHVAAPVDEAKVTELDRKVFGDRKFYSMTLNMPNLNSAGGSWVIRFAELKTDQPKGDLTAPVPTQKVDPAYPIRLMEEHVEGNVTLYAVIHSDGSVGEVKVLRGVDDRLDEYACTAFSGWKFRPATKNGSAVALEAVVVIPFRARRREF